MANVSPPAATTPATTQTLPNSNTKPLSCSDDKNVDIRHAQDFRTFPISEGKDNERKETVACLEYHFRQAMASQTPYALNISEPLNRLRRLEVNPDSDNAFNQCSNYPANGEFDNSDQMVPNLARVYKIKNGGEEKYYNIQIDRKGLSSLSENGCYQEIKIENMPLKIYLDQNRGMTSISNTPHRIGERECRFMNPPPSFEPIPKNSERIPAAPFELKKRLRDAILISERSRLTLGDVHNLYNRLTPVELAKRGDAVHYRRILAHCREMIQELITESKDNKERQELQKLFSIFNESSKNYCRNNKVVAQGGACVAEGSVNATLEPTPTQVDH